MKRLLILLLPLLVLLVPVPTQGQATSRAGVVVRFSDGSIHSRCVSFQGESISGLQLLQRSGLDVIAQTSGNNAAVCKIGPDGCSFPAEPCFCKFGGGQQGQYWAYWRLNGNAWQYAIEGAGSRRVSNGAVDGWAWGTGSVQSGAQPPVTTFEQICPAPQPTAEPTPRPTTKPTPKPTARPTTQPTPRPTLKPTSRPTTRPTMQPTAPIVAEAPTPQPTDLPTATATSAPTATSTPTSTPTTTPGATSTPTMVAPTTMPTATSPPTAVPERSGGGTLGSYLVFGAMLTGLLGAIGIAQWRRRQ